EKLKHYDYSSTAFRLRIPDRSISIKYPSRSGATQPPRAQTQKFIPWQLERASLTEPTIAPILPGRYGVIGSAGTNYNLDDTDPTKQIYTTTVGRRDQSSVGTGWDTDDGSHDPAS